MKRVEIIPHSKSKLSSPMTILLKDYWCRSAAGFGVYTQAVSESLFKRIGNCAKLFDLQDSDGKAYKLKPTKVGSGYFVMIKPV